MTDGAAGGITATSTPTPDGAPALEVLRPARRLGRYVLRARLGAGGFATVSLAQLAGSDGFRKWFAVKTLRHDVADDPRAVAMFLDEARLAARIDHPNVCQVVDFGADGGAYYLVMEYLRGEALRAVAQRAWSRDGGLPYATAARIVADAARGLHAAHELRGADGQIAGVVHRDVSPQNLFVLYDGVTRLVDFGIARSRDRLAENTRSDEMRGKAAYMAPEQVASRGAVDRRADVFALGVVLWEITVGRRLFKRDNDAATVFAVMYEPVPSPAAVRADYPPALGEVVMRALERAPEARYQTAAAMADALDAYLRAAGSDAGTADVRARMHAWFAPEIAARDAMLRAMSEAPADAAVDAGGALARPVDDEPTARDVSDTRRARGAAGGRRGVAAVTAGLALVAAAAIGAPRIAASLRGGTSTTVGATARAEARRAEVVLARATPEASEVSVAPPVPPPPLQRAQLGAPATPPRDAVAEPARRHGMRAARGRPAGTTAAEPAAPGAAGYLNIVAIPSVPVFDGATPLGNTPLFHVGLPSGRHVLRFVPRDGRAPQVRTVDVVAGAVRSVPPVRWP